MIKGRQRNRARTWYRSKRLKKTEQDPTKVVVDLPEDLIFTEILTRLPVTPLTRFKSVSRKWCSTISSPEFIKSHLERTRSNPFVSSDCVFIRSPYYFYILNYGAYDRYPDNNHGQKGLFEVKSLSFYDNGVNTFLIGSCNGLVCFGRGKSSSVVDYTFNVYNPLMGHCYHVLDPLGNFGGNLIYGFGYVSLHDDYRLFVGGLQRRSSENFVYVYSLRSKEWRKIGAFDESEFLVFWGGRGVLVNETLHWDMKQVWTLEVKNHICGFDLVTESFKYVQAPEFYVGDPHYLDLTLCDMGGSLCAWTENIDGGVEMCMLKQYGKWDSWTKIFKFDMFPGLSNFYGCTANGKVLVQTGDGSLVLADPNHSPPMYTTLVKDLGDIEVVSYVRSPVSPFLSNVH